MSMANETHRWKRWLVLLAALVLVGGALGGRYWWYTRPSSPPEVPLAGLESELADILVETRAAVLQDPRNPETWGTYGRALQVNEVFPEASRICFEEAERLAPEDPRWPYFLADAHLSMGNREEAVAKLQRTVALCDSRQDMPEGPRLLLAETLASLEHAEEAESIFLQSLVVVAPENARAHFGLGTLAFSRGDWPACRKHLERCVGSPQTRKKACAQLATVCEQLGDKFYADYYANLQARLPKDVGWTDSFLNEHAHLTRLKRHRYRMVDQLEAQGQFAKAEIILKQMIKAYPTEDTPHLAMGRIVAQMGQYERAEGHLRIALKLAPEKYQAHYLLALALFRRGETLWFAKDGDKAKATELLEESAALSRHVIAQRPDYGFAHMALGLTLKYLDQGDASLAEFREAVHCNPEYAENHFHLGVALAERGNLKEARFHLEQAKLMAAPNDRRPQAALDKYFAKPKS
jgi:tetratricopeptide (TPR) repeat protein